MMDATLEQAVAALLPDLEAQSFTAVPDESLGLDEPDDDEPGPIKLALDEGDENQTPNEGAPR